MRMLDKILCILMSISLFFPMFANTTAYAQVAAINSMVQVTAQPILVGRAGSFHTQAEWSQREAQRPTTQSTIVEGHLGNDSYHLEMLNSGSAPSIPLMAGDGGTEASGLPPISLQLGVMNDNGSSSQLSFPNADPSAIQTALNSDLAQAAMNGAIGAKAQQDAYDQFAQNAIKSYQNQMAVSGLQAQQMLNSANKIASQTAESEITMAAAMGAFAYSQQGGDSQAIKEAKRNMNDPLYSRTYNLSGGAVGEVEGQIQAALGAQDFSKAAKLVEMLKYNPSTATTKIDFVNQENVAQFEKLSSQIPKAPLSDAKFSTDKNSEQGQVVRRIVNMYQAKWAETSGLQNFSDSQKVMYGVGVQALMAADRNIASPKEAGVGSGLLVTSVQILNGLTDGFNSSFGEAIQGFSALTQQAPGLANAMENASRAMMDSVNHPDEALRAAVRLGKNIPGVLEQVKWQATRDMDSLAQASPYQKAHILGAAFGNALMTVQVISTGVFGAIGEGFAVLTDAFTTGVAGAEFAEVAASMAKLDRIIQAAAGGNPEILAALKGMATQDAYLETTQGVETELAKSGYKLTTQDYSRIAQEYISLAEGLQKVVPVAENPTVFRALRSDVVEAAISRGSSKVEAVFGKHISQILMPNRFGIGGELGQGGIYAANDIQTAIAEVGGNSTGFQIESKTFELDKVLDLTSPETTVNLGKTAVELSRKLSVSPSAYELPQLLRMIAEKRGYQAIKYFSAANNPPGVCWIIFE